MEYFLQILTYTLVLAALYTFIGTGFALRTSVAKYLDIGYAVYMTLGAYLYFTFGRYVDVYAVFPAIIMTAVFAYSVEKFYFSRLAERQASSLVMMIASLGLMILVQAIIAMFFTSTNQVLHTDMWSIKIFSVVLLGVEIIGIVSALAFVIGLNLLLKKSKLGTQIRAIGDSKQLAETAGIPVKKLSLWIAGVSGGIAALAGIFYGLLYHIHPLMGLSLLLSGVTAALLVNVQNIGRVYLGAIVLATVQNMAVWYFGGEWKDFITFLLMIIILLIRPRGFSDSASVRVA